MRRDQLVQNIKRTGSFLCVGLDTDFLRLPQHLSQDARGMLEFNRAIIEATSEYCIAYKLNTAFYEALGVEGWRVLEESIRMIPKDKFVIADAKRGDIGNTSALYARAFFQEMNCDALTVAPYMGHDSVEPFFQFSDRWVILLALTSNPGSQDFQILTCGGKPLYEQVIRKACTWGSSEDTMFVVGATRANELQKIREMAPEHFFLVPGIGAQGGNLRRTCEAGLNDDIGLIVNSSRSIIYASAGPDFAEAAGKAARELQMEMNDILLEKGLI